MCIRGLHTVATSVRFFSRGCSNVQLAGGGPSHREGISEKPFLLLLSFPLFSQVHVPVICFIRLGCYLPRNDILGRKLPFRRRSKCVQPTFRECDDVKKERWERHFIPSPFGVKNDRRETGEPKRRISVERELLPLYKTFIITRTSLGRRYYNSLQLCVCKLRRLREDNNDWIKSTPYSSSDKSVSVCGACLPAAKTGRQQW